MEMVTINKNQERKNTTISVIKNIQEITSRLDEAEDLISELEDKVERNTQVEQLHKKKTKNCEDSLRELQDNMKHNNVWIIWIPGQQKQQWRETLFEKLMTENILNWEREKSLGSGTTQGLKQDELEEPYSKTHNN